MRISDWSSDVCSSDLLERPAARYVDQCQYVAVVEQALVALERPPAAHHIIQPRHIVNADIRRQAQLSQRTVPAAATQAGQVDGGGVGHAVILAFGRGINTAGACPGPASGPPRPTTPVRTARSSSRPHTDQATPHP